MIINQPNIWLIISLKTTRLSLKLTQYYGKCILLYLCGNREQVITLYVTTMGVHWIHGRPVGPK